MAIDINKYAEHTINYFRKHYVTDGVEINYQLIGTDTIKFKIPKEEYNSITQKLEADEIDFEVIPTDRKMVLVFQQHNGKKLLKTKVFHLDIFFVEYAALRNVENIKNVNDLNIKNWTDFFELIDPEYRNLITRIVNGIPIATHKNEYNKVISKKIYWIDPINGLYEKKEKLINDEWKVTYQHVTNNLHQVFRMFFKYFEDTTLNELTDFDTFKQIVSKTKYKLYL